MIGSITSVGQSLDRVSRRAFGRYVEAVSVAGDAGGRSSAPEIEDLRSEAVVEAEVMIGRRVTGDPASAPFVAQLAAFGLGDAVTGERRVRRDPTPVLARADALYRDGYRRVTDLEPGFFGTAEY